MLLVGTCCGGGATCCCCCCCLHWVGAAVGGTAGIAAACLREDEKSGSPVRWTMRRRVLWATWIVVLGAAALLTVAWVLWDSDEVWIIGPAAVIFTAAVGGAAGMVVAYHGRDKQPGRAVHRIARKYILASTWVAVLGTAALITAAAIWVSGGSGTGSGGRDATEGLLWGLAFVPSLALLPVGAAALIGAGLARWIEKARRSDPAERRSISAALGLAWRIAWMSFVWSTFLSGAGYLAMYVIALFIE